MVNRSMVHVSRPATAVVAMLGVSVKQLVETGARDRPRLRAVRG
jgi:hypothetical protein